MGFWEKIEKDIKKNIREGLSFFREGGTAFSQKIEKFTEEGRRKYKIFTLKMKVQDEFTKLGGKVYDLNQKSKNPMNNKSVNAIISRIRKLENQINAREKKVLKGKAKRVKRRTPGKSKSPK